MNHIKTRIRKIRELKSITAKDMADRLDLSLFAVVGVPQGERARLTNNTEYRTSEQAIVPPTGSSAHLDLKLKQRTLFKKSKNEAIKRNETKMSVKHILIVLLLTANSTYGLEKFLEFISPCKGVHPSFTKVNVIDNRLAGQTLGFVQVGPLNSIAYVKFKGNLADSLSKFFISADTLGKVHRELTIILYELYISEKTEFATEIGKIRVSMRLFSHTDQEKFQEMFTVDTIYTCQAIDVTNKLLRSVSERMCEIAGRTTTKPSTSIESPLYSIEELRNLDSLEKLKIPIYTSSKLNPGIYANYERFKTNTPDSSIVSFDTLASNILAYKWDNEKKKRVRIDNKKVYAVCDGNTLLKATSIGFYRLRKIGLDFYYVGQTSFSNSNNIAFASAYFGLIGAAIASEAERNTQLFRFKINYLKGNSIPVAKASN